MRDDATPTERPYRLPPRIYFEHTDALGITYHSNYLNFFERARSEIIGLGELVRLREEQLGFVVYDVSMRFKLPSKLGDDLEIRSLVKPMSAVRLRCWQDAYRVSEAGRAMAAAVKVRVPFSPAVDANKKLSYCRRPVETSSTRCSRTPRASPISSLSWRP